MDQAAAEDIAAQGSYLHPPTEVAGNSSTPLPVTIH
jgi:hypothetical protein